MDSSPARPGLTPEELLEQGPWIDRLAGSMVRDPNGAADVAQEARLKALAHPPSRVDSIRGWLSSVVRSCAMDRRRAEERRGRRELAAGRRGSISVPDMVVRAEAQKKVIEAVLDLDGPSRTVVLMRYFEGLEPAEIAVRLGEPPGTVRSRLHRALESLRRRLDREYGGDGGAWALAILGPGFEGRLLGGATMAAKVKSVSVAVLLLLLLLGGGAAWMAWPTGGESLTGTGRTAAVPAPQSVKAPVPIQGGAPDSPVPSSAVSAAAAAGAAPAARRLPLLPLEPREPDVPPDLAGDAAGGVAPVVAGDAAGGEDGGGGGMMLMGGWTKWAPVEEKGTALLAGRVVDHAGRPLAGAEILRVEAAAGGVDGDVVSFEHIHAIAKTAADGTFEARDQPARPVRLAANWKNAMNRPAGFLIQGLVPVDPAESQAVRGLQLAVPVNREAFGSVAGRVVDDEGEPVVVEVYAGYRAARTGADGTFRFDGVPAGAAALVAEKYGWVRHRQEILVAAGHETKAEIVMTPRGTGTLELSGTVVDDEGRPAAGLRILCGGTEDVYREARSDARGAFRFRRLPESVATNPLYVSAMADPERDGFLPLTVDGVRVPGPVRLVVDRAVLLRLLVRDAATKEILPLFNVDCQRETTLDGERRLVPFEAAALHEEDGAWEVHVPRGRMVLFVEAPDRIPVHAAVEVPSEPGPFEVMVEMGR